MKNALTLVIVLCTSLSLIAQSHPTCDGLRYVTKVFESVDSTEAVMYVENITINGASQELFMDIYEPAGDIAEKRPVIILAFGGSYIGGEREDMRDLCVLYAQRGFVAVTIDYRLYDGPLFPIPSGETFQDVVAKSVSDMKAAIRFLREDAATNNQFRIESDFVFVGGISAGSITASHTAVLDDTDIFTTTLQDILDSNGGIEGNSSDNFEYSTEVQAYVNFSGGLNDASWIDENDPPFFSVHDDNDGVVPYGNGFATIFGIEIIEMQGSKVMSDQANAVGVPNILKTIEDSDGHVSYLFSEADIETYTNKSAIFLHNLMCENQVASNNNLTSQDFNIYPNPSNGSFQIAFANEINNGTLQMTDMTGQVLITQQLQNVQLWQINMNLPQGAYSLSIQTNDGIATQRLIIH